ncbi:MAG TPA: hypothetical protein VEH04_14830 [Verrucomicrobiae bacterium]|nr:hypothetical protein [Verrucomicrobiae bacterium]
MIGLARSAVFPGTNLLTISGIATNGVTGGLFAVAAGTTNLIRGIRLDNAALAGDGAVLVNAGSTMLQDCLVESHHRRLRTGEWHHYRWQ